MTSSSVWEMGMVVIDDPRDYCPEVANQRSITTPEITDWEGINRVVLLLVAVSLGSGSCSLVSGLSGGLSSKARPRFPSENPREAVFPFQSRASSPPTRWTRLNTVQLEPFAVVPSSLLPLPPLRHPTTRASEPLAAGWSASSETQTPEASGLTRSLPFALNSSSFSSKS